MCILTVCACAGILAIMSVEECVGSKKSIARVSRSSGLAFLMKDISAGVYSRFSPLGTFILQNILLPLEILPREFAKTIEVENNVLASYMYGFSFPDYLALNRLVDFCDQHSIEYDEENVAGGTGIKDALQCEQQDNVEGSQRSIVFGLSKAGNKRRLAAALVGIRKERGFVQEEAAGVIGVPRKTYGLYERGAHFPDVERLDNLIIPYLEANGYTVLKQVQQDKVFQSQTYYVGNNVRAMVLLLEEAQERLGIPWDELAARIGISSAALTQIRFSESLMPHERAVGFIKDFLQGLGAKVIIGSDKEERESLY